VSSVLGRKKISKIWKYSWRFTANWFSTSNDGTDRDFDFDLEI
jgi:hypothetical protein